MCIGVLTLKHTCIFVCYIVSYGETFAQLYLVMLNLFQHLIISVSYETLKQVQGDNYGIMQRSHGRDFSLRSK